MTTRSVNNLQRYPAEHQRNEVCPPSRAHRSRPDHCCHAPCQGNLLLPGRSSSKKSSSAAHLPPLQTVNPPCCVCTSLMFPQGRLTPRSVKAVVRCLHLKSQMRLRQNAEAVSNAHDMHLFLRHSGGHFTFVKLQESPEISANPFCRVMNTG